MKLKNHDWTEQEQRQAAADAHFLPQDRTLQTVLLATVIFGVVVLVWVALYLLDLSWTPQELTWNLKRSRFWPGD